MSGWRRAAGSGPSAAHPVNGNVNVHIKVLVVLVPEKFNTFNTFSTFSIFNAQSDDLRPLELLVPQSSARYSPAVRG